MSSATTGDSFQSLENARTYQSDLWRHKIQLKHLRWSVLAKLFVVNLCFQGDSIFRADNLIVSPRPHPNKPAAREGFLCVWRSNSQLCYNATPQNRLCLKDSISQRNWCSPWDTAVEESPCSRLDLGAIKLASSESQLGAEQTRHEKALSWNNRQVLSVCGKYRVMGHIIRQ